MLWQRVVTALVLAPLVIGGILFLDTPWFALVLALIVMLGAHEMGRLANVRQPLWLVGFSLAVGVAAWVAWDFLLAPLLPPLQWIMSAWWVLVTLFLVFRRRELLRIASRRPSVLMLGGIVLVTAWASIAGLHASGPGGPVLVLVLFVLIWVADSGAYFAGRAFGATKLSPLVSPGKTWAGVGGALAGATLAAVVVVSAGWAGDAALLPFILLSVLVTLVSIGGDLWESRLKREAGVKDSGSLLPGHGGVLDRIDSLLAAAPVFALGARLVGASS
jgi:phosphatidate cytidylyltransferase